MLAPYVHSKRGATIVPRYVEHPIDIPEFQTVEDAEKFLGIIPSLLNSGQLDAQLAQDYSTLTRNWLSAQYEKQEFRLKEANANYQPGEHVIKIQGGLPALPGTNILLPNINNGERVNDTTLPLGPPEPSLALAEPATTIELPIATKWLRATRPQSTVVSWTSDQRRQPRPNMSKNRRVYLALGHPTPAQSTATHRAVNACTGPIHGALHTGNAAPKPTSAQSCINP